MNRDMHRPNRTHVLSLSLLVALSAAVACGKKQDASAPPVTSAPAGSASVAAPAVAPSAAPAAAPAAAGAPKPGSKAAKCGAGTALVATDNQDAKCLKQCVEDKDCAKGQSCTPGNGTDDDGNPIPHDIINVCVGPAGGAAAKPAASAKPAAAPAPGTMEVLNPGNPPCPAGYSDQGVLASCNKSCTAAKDCKAPFTCTSVTGDPTKICVDSKHLHTR